MNSQRNNKNHIDMLNGPLWNKILLFAVPVAAASVLQQLFNAADMVVAGRFAGEEALAAVGGNASVIALLVNLFVGVSVGANVVIANYIGRGEKEKISDAVHTTISLAIIGGIALAILGQFIAAPIVELIDTPEDVEPLAVLYLRIFFTGSPFMFTYNFGAAILRSTGDTRRPLICLALSGVINVCLNLFLVIVFDLSVAGVAIATVISNIISSSFIMYFLMHEEDYLRFSPKKLAIHREPLLSILRIGIPSGLQGVVFSLSNVCIQSGINGFGTAAAAGSAAAQNYEYFTYFVTNAFGQAAVTFVGQNYGARKMDRCRTALRQTMIFSLIVTTIESFVFVFWWRFFAGLYTTDLDAMQFAMVRMFIVESLEGLIAFYEIPAGAMRGMGVSMRPTVYTIFGACILRLIWLATVFTWTGREFWILLIVYPVSWVVTSCLVMTSYLRLRTRKEKEVLGNTAEPKGTELN